MNENVKNVIIKMILGVVAIAGFLLLLIHLKNEYYEPYIISKMQEEDIEVNKNVDQIISEGLEPLGFVSDKDIKEGRADEIVPVTKESYEKYRNDMKRTVRKGRLIIPSVEMNLGIYEGLHNAVLLKGAGEQLPRNQQKMGESGNYILASHKMKKRNALFNRLPDVKKGDLIFVTDEIKVYVYEADIIRGVHISENYWINEITTEKLITLYTCLDTWVGKQERTIVRGHLIDEFSVTDIKPEYNYLKIQNHLS